jgi:FHA domain-containing protein
MDLLGKARRLESTIAARLDEAAKGLVRSRPREPLEIVHAILDAVDREIQPTGRGTRAFPFNRIKVSVPAPSKQARGRLEAVLAGEIPLQARIVERLRSAGCSPPPVVVSISYVDRAEDTWRSPDFDLEFARVTQPEASVDTRKRDSKPAPIEVTVVRGVTDQSTYALAAARIDVGRCAEVRDHLNRLIRTNHIAFTEGAADVNETVSRQHAHIAYESRTGHFRLHDDGSGHGTGIVRDGRTISVPRGSRGVRLQSEDEIVLGEARVRIRFVCT